MPSIGNPRDLRHFDQEVTGQGLAESILPAQSIQEIKQHDQTGAFDLFGPVIGSESLDQGASSKSSGSAAPTQLGQQQKGGSVNAASSPEEEKKD